MLILHSFLHTLEHMELTKEELVQEQQLLHQAIKKMRLSYLQHLIDGNFNQAREMGEVMFDFLNFRLRNIDAQKEELEKKKAKQKKPRKPYTKKQKVPVVVVESVATGI